MEIEDPCILARLVSCQAHDLLLLLLVVTMDSLVMTMTVCVCRLCWCCCFGWFGTSILVGSICRSDRSSCHPSWSRNCTANARTDPACALKDEHGPTHFCQDVMSPNILSCDDRTGLSGAHPSEQDQPFRFASTFRLARVLLRDILTTTILTMLTMMLTTLVKATQNRVRHHRPHRHHQRRAYHLGRN